MKRLFVLLTVAIFLVACGDKGEVLETKTEMTKEETLEHLEQITYRLIEAWEDDAGSFEQKSSLQAALGRSESVMEEIQEEYGEIPIIDNLDEVGSLVRVAVNDSDEVIDNIKIEIYLEMIVEEIQEFPNLDGELPPTITSFFDKVNN